MFGNLQVPSSLGINVCAYGIQPVVVDNWQSVLLFVM